MNLPVPVRPRVVETVRPSLPQVLHRVNGYAAQEGYQPIDEEGTSIVGASMAELIVDRLIETRGIHQTELPGQQPGSGLPLQPAPLDQIALPAVRGAGDELHLQYEVPGTFAHHRCPCGDGMEVCSSCGGQGRNYCSPTRYTSEGNKPCFTCGGTGSTLCYVCSGAGRVTHTQCAGSAWLTIFGLAEIRRDTVRETHYVETPASPTAKQVVDWPRHEQRISAGLQVPAEIEGQVDELLRTAVGERYIDGRLRLLPLTALRDVEGKTLAIINDAGDQIILTAQRQRRRLLTTLGVLIGIVALVVVIYLAMPR